MRFEPTPVAECVVIVPEPFEDDRGFLARIWCADELGAAGLDTSIAQVNLAGSVRAGTTRGLHWQVAPYAEAKVVRCVRGAAFDVCVDVRQGSPSLGQWFGLEIDPVDRLALYIPPGCAHGYQTLVDDTEVLYTTSAPYHPPAERGARWDDPALGIDWPIRTGAVVSAKDLAWPVLDRSS